MNYITCNYTLAGNCETRAPLCGVIYSRGVPLLGNEMMNEQDFVSNFVSNINSMNGR